LKTETYIHKGSHAKQYLSKAPWYLLSSITTKSISFFLLPIYTRYLSPEDYGILANIESFGRLLPVFLSLYLDSAFGRFYFKEKHSQGRVRKLYSTHFWFLILWGGGLGLLTIIFSPFLFKSLLGVTIIPIIIIVITSLLNQLGVMVSVVWRANLWTKNISIFQISTTLLGAGFSIYLLTVKDMGWQSRIFGMGCVAFFQFIILTTFALRNNWLVFKFDKSMLKRSLWFSIPLIPNIAAGWISGFSDRIILAHYGRLDEAGLYSIAATLTMFLYIFNNAVTQVQGPLFFSGLTENKKEAKKKLESFLMLFVAVMSILYLGLSLFSKEVLIIFTDDRYHQAYILITILGPIYIFSGIYRIFTNVILFHGLTWIISIAAIIQAIINILLNFTFIPVFGMYAAAYSTLVSMFSYTLWIVWQAQRTDPIIINYKSIFYIFGLIISVIFLHVLLDLIIDHQWQLIALKFIILSFSIILIYYIPEINVIVKNMFRLRKLNWIA
jgi:O-antigen/teichoic acid export membrane protein